MANPVLYARISFDDASVASPTWVDVSSSVKSFDISKGRDSELEDIDAGVEEAGQLAFKAIEKSPSVGAARLAYAYATAQTGREG